MAGYFRVGSGVKDGTLSADQIDDMSSPAVEPSGPDPHTPVFVDDSGRRSARVRIVVRLIVAMLGLYVALAAFSLVAPVSFPIAHLGNLGLLPRHRQNATLGPRIKEAPLPAALAGTGNGSGTAPGGADVPTGTTLPSSQPTTPGGSAHAGVTVPPALSSTATTHPTATTTTATTPRSHTTTTVGGSTTTTHPNGPPTTGPHGPPSKTPGKGSKP